MPQPTVVVLCDRDRPPLMDQVEREVAVRYTGADRLEENLAGADVLFCWDFLSDALVRAWPAADRLQWVHMASAGVDPVLFDGLVASDVSLTNSRGVFDRPVAEYVLTLVLAHAKDLFTTWRLQHQATWRHRETARVTGRRALVVGSGPIGRTTGQLLQAAGMTVTLVGGHRREGDPQFGTVYGADELRPLLAEADHVVALAPLTESTRGMFDAAAFAAMREGAQFVNVGRGELVSEDALLESLRSGHLGAAALDVFATEPLPANHPLWASERVLISPHMAGDTGGWHEDLAGVFLDNLRRWREGRSLRNVVDKHRGYVPVEPAEGGFRQAQPTDRPAQPAGDQAQPADRPARAEQHDVQPHEGQENP